MRTKKRELPSDLVETLTKPEVLRDLEEALAKLQLEVRQLLDGCRVTPEDLHKPINR